MGHGVKPPWEKDTKEIKDAQKIIKSINSYMKSHDPYYQRQFLDMLRTAIDGFDSSFAATGEAASGAKGQNDMGAEISRMEKEAWDKWQHALAKHNDAKQRYDYWKEAEEYFETSVRPLNEPFRQVTELLSYFVPCRTKEDYKKRAAVLLNKQHYLCGSLQPGKWGECLTSDRLSKIRLPGDEPQPVEKDKIPFEPSKGSFESIKAAASYEAETKVLIEETRDYLYDLKQMENARLQNQKFWENAMLLRDFLPAIELLRQFEGAEDRPALAAEIGAMLADAVANHECIDPEMRFLWLFPEGDAYRESLPVRLEFILAEANCPGLYYTLGTGAPVCVVRGRVVEKE